VTLHECPRESDVLDAVASARWPDRVSPELVAHVAACAVCADVAIVAQALRDDEETAEREASVPPSGQVWWRAEMRARQEAVRAASRPIAIAQWVAAALTLGLTLVAGGLAWPWMQRYLSAVDVRQATLAASPFALPLLVALGTLAVVAPLALYLVLSDD
jgi:hypothetical protein